MPNVHGQPQTGEEVLLANGNSVVIRRYERTTANGMYVVSLQRPSRQEFATIAAFDPQEAFWREWRPALPVQHRMMIEHPAFAPIAGDWRLDPWYRRAWRWLKRSVR
jgi:hypothetical protein